MIALSIVHRAVEKPNVVTAHAEISISENKNINHKKFDLGLLSSNSYAKPFSHAGGK